MAIIDDTWFVHMNIDPVIRVACNVVWKRP